MRRLSCRRVLPSLDLMVDGRLADGEAGAIRQHLDVCEGCRGEYERLLRLKAALASQPRPEMARDALGRLHAALPGERRTVRLRSVVVGVAVALALAALSAYLPRVLRPGPTRGSERLAVAPAAPVPDAALTQPTARPERVERPAKRGGTMEQRPAARPPRARRAVRHSTAGRSDPGPTPGNGSVIVVIIAPTEAPSSREASVALQLATIRGADGLPEANVSLTQTVGQDGVVESIEYAYRPVVVGGGAVEPADSQEETNDDSGRTDDTSSVGGERGAGSGAGAAVRGAEAA